jgi:hypothetical protein
MTQVWRGIRPREEARFERRAPLDRARCAGCDHPSPARLRVAPWPAVCRTDLASLARQARGPSPRRAREVGSGEACRQTGAAVAEETQGRGLRPRPRLPQCGKRHVRPRIAHRLRATIRAGLRQIDGRSRLSTLHPGDSRVGENASPQRGRAARPARRSFPGTLRPAPRRRCPSLAPRHQRRDRGRGLPAVHLLRSRTRSPGRTASRSGASSPT